jgi:hypothetical protein
VATQEDVPGHIKTLCASLLQKGGDRRAALAFLVDRYLETRNPISRELFVDKIAKLHPPRADAPSEEARRRVARKVLREAEVEPMAKHMALEVLSDYLTGEIRPGTAKLLGLLGE